MDKIAETSVAVHDLIARRWSPRALDPAAEIDDRRVRALLEAARWAPSSGNTQPARFLLGRRSEATFTRILGTLAEGNQGWAHRAGVLLIGCAVTRNEKGEIPLSEYAVGLASQNLVLQAVAEGLVGHQMAGFDADAVRREFALPEDVRPVVAIAVGTQVEPEILAEDRRIERERAPRRRIPLAEFAFTGEWGSPAF
ncbi:nitroreductase family protein [Amycolatopsis cihanbeyliensis]|uniref:Nitroreductase n=1 Tax=Amycolatopsis cihanbeyliensis TaxID=1128664 RepID=A0A542DMU5_AMYCI|nr:nitroreductase family protein [Amycolatopsis cihanbeyliensis]TQJ04406.1 nitroreductase [Amycolatopsis cihanbeyliensis]